MNQSLQPPEKNTGGHHMKDLIIALRYFEMRGEEVAVRDQKAHA